MHRFKAKPSRNLCSSRSRIVLLLQSTRKYNIGLTSTCYDGWYSNLTMPPNKCTIAIVEDDASFRRAVERFLWASGFDTQSFASAEEFLHTTEPESHACLIIDLQLPGISGIDLVERLNALAVRPPAIFITAQEIANFQERVSRIPEILYLRKPFPGVALLEAVNAALKQSGPDSKHPST